MKNKKFFALILIGLLLVTGNAFSDTILTTNVLDDTFVDIYVPDTNGTQNTILRLRHQDPTWGLMYGLIKFDLSEIPTNIIVNYARISLWTDLATDDDSWTPSNSFPLLAMHNNTENWSEDTVTWNTAPTYDTTPVETLDHFDVSGPKFTLPDMVSAGGWLFFDENPSAVLVQNWANGIVSNYGVSIMATGTYTSTSRYFDLFSSRHPNVIYSMTPYLYVDYTIIPEPATLGLFGIIGTWLFVSRRKK